MEALACSFPTMTSEKSTPPCLARGENPSSLPYFGETGRVGRMGFLPYRVDQKPIWNWYSISCKASSWYDSGTLVKWRDYSTKFTSRSWVLSRWDLYEKWSQKFDPVQKAAFTAKIIFSRNLDDWTKIIITNELNSIFRCFDLNSKYSKKIFRSSCRVKKILEFTRSQ